MNLRKVYIVTSFPGRGKTTFLSKLTHLLKKDNITVAGLVAHGAWKNKNRSGFVLEDLSTGKTMPLATTGKKKRWKPLGNFYFNPETVSFANMLLHENEILTNDAIILDEIGPFELNGELWARGLTRITKEYSGILIISVRPNLVNKVTEYWNLPGPEVINVINESPGQIRNQIKQILER